MNAVERRLQLRDETRARFGEPDAARRALKQPHADALLERLQRPGPGADGVTRELGRCGGEASLFGRRPGTPCRPGKVFAHSLAILNTTSRFHAFSEEALRRMSMA